MALIISNATALPHFQVRVDSPLEKNSENLFEFFKAGIFVDSTLTSGQKVVKAHKIILCTVEYFESMFMRGWRESVTALPM